MPIIRCLCTAALIGAWSIALSTPSFSEQFQVSLASFHKKENAEAFLALLNSGGYNVEQEEVEVGGKLYFRILSTRIHDHRDSALLELADLRRSHYFHGRDTSGFWLRSCEARPLGAALVPTELPVSPWHPSTTLEETALEAFLTREDPSLGLIAGRLLDSVTGRGIPEVLVSMDSDVPTASSDLDGSYRLQAPPGKTVTIKFSKPGFDFESQRVAVHPDRPSVIPENRTVGNPVLSQGTKRFVLTWGQHPLDLDSHLITPSGSHVNYLSSSPWGSHSQLDTDDISSFGPETITIEKMEPGKYLYFVHNYSGYPEMAGTEAVVRVYDETGLIHTATIPSSGSGDFWVIGTLDEAGFTPLNVLKDRSDLN